MNAGKFTLFNATRFLTKHMTNSVFPNLNSAMEFQIATTIAMKRSTSEEISPLAKGNI